ncbi:tRNA lysidine(34) synthetase TilS [Hydrogenimonas sp.]
MLEPEALQRLRGRKNLLAFSGGVDSSALYHLLKEAQIDFDIALVNYLSRPESDAEEAHAEALAAKDGRRLHLHRRKLEGGDFERRAREVRYAFFETIIANEGYDTLITAHQLDDMLEWGLMQLVRGCGTAEFVGMQPVEERPGYTLVRPLLFTPKSELLHYLKSRDLPYFIDRSNLSDTHTRNRFRKEAAAFLMRESSEGIARSFRYMLEDKEALGGSPKVLFEYKELLLLQRPDGAKRAIRQIDRALKARGYLLSAAQKEEILHNDSVVVGGAWVVERQRDRIWIAPYRQTTMPKPFKESCRRCNIPPKVRPYLFLEGADETLLSALCGRMPDPFSS